MIVQKFYNFENGRKKFFYLCICRIVGMIIKNLIFSITFHFLTIFFEILNFNIQPPSERTLNYFHHLIGRCARLELLHTLLPIEIGRFVMLGVQLPQTLKYLHVKPSFYGDGENETVCFEIIIRNIFFVPLII